MNKKYYTPNTVKPQTATVGEFRQVGLESDAIIQRVSKDLYASPASGVRELLANEIRAAVKAKEGGARPRIEVTVTDETVRVWGIDSLGMEKDIFDTVYMTLGRSSNFDGKTAGQFGLGRAAYTTISDHMLLETNCRNGDKYSVLGVEGRGYQTGLPEPDIPYGTRITMAPRERTTHKMEKMVRDTAKRSPIPIRLITKDGIEDMEWEPLPDRAIYADTEHFEFGANIYHYRQSAGPAYLCGIPIEFKYCGKYGLGDVTLDIRDERMFPPTPDRERMTEKAEKDISRLIDSVVDVKLSVIPRDLAGALSHPDVELAVALLGNEIPGLNRHVTVHRQRKEVRLYEVNGSPIINCAVFYQHKIDAIRAKFPNAAFVKGADGLTGIDDFMAEHGITANQRDVRRSRTEAVLHTHDGTIRINPNKPPKNLVIYKVAGGADLRINHSLIKNRKGVALTVYDVKGAHNLGELVEASIKHTYQTSHGPMTGRQLLDSDHPTYSTNRLSLMECWGTGLCSWREAIMVYDGEGGAEYAALYMQSDSLNIGTDDIEGWYGDEHAMEVHLRLENPTLKAASESEYVHESSHLDELMRLDGKEPIQHNFYCDCRDCR